MKTLIKLYAILLVSVVTMVAPSCNRENSETNDKKDAESRNDQKFVKPDETDAKYVVDAYAAGMKEIRYSERVKDRLSNTDDKNFAETMITEHTAMNDKMRALASSKQISLPTELTQGEQNDLDDLMKKSGTDLDKAYLDGMIDDHKNAVDLFEKASSKATDEDIRNAFNDGLPKIRMHLQMAQSARDKIK
jgi:putative membrane protein